MDTREQQLQIWLQQKLTEFNMTLIEGDASFRRYFRVMSAGQTYVAMDAPPDLEDSVTFVDIAKLFQHAGLHVPRIIAYDLAEGFLLLEDLGVDLYKRILTPDNADRLYKKAIDKLMIIQSVNALDLPLFDEERLNEELSNFNTWFIERHLQLTLSSSQQVMIYDLFKLLIDNAESQPQVCIHRDYHSRNLLDIPEDLGIIDFQDAALGPLTYDLVSLIRDCYIAWEDEHVYRWLSYYYAQLEHPDFSESTLRRWFDLMGIQRHLKAIFIFSRKFHRDHNDYYLDDVGRGLHYVLSVCERYPECQDFLNFTKNTIMPRYQAVQRELHQQDRVLISEEREAK